MDYYSEISQGYNELYGDEQIKKVKLILRYLKIKDTDKVLDVGCGTAFYSNLFPNYTGIDKSEGMLNNLKCILGDAEALPFEDSSFDVIISITAIHNFRDIEKAINEMKRVGKGKIAISVLKRSARFNAIKELITKNFKVKEIEEEKDVIFISQE